MAYKYASLGVIEVDGQELELTKCTVKTELGRKAVKTINRKRRVKGFAEGIRTYALSITVAVPMDGNEPDWDEMEDAKVTIEEENGKRISYLNCFCLSYSESYTVDEEKVRDIEVVPLDKVIE